MVTKEQYVEVFEDFIETLIKQQAEMTIDVHSLTKTLEKHRSDCAKYRLEYHYDEKTSTYSYTKIAKKKIGF